MAETYTGEVRNGVVVFDAGEAPPLPEGTKVQVEPIGEGGPPLADGRERPAEPVDMEAAIRDLSRRLLSLAGICEGLPSDFAEQHDHYIHGTPKRRSRDSPTRFTSLPS